MAKVNKRKNIKKTKKAFKDTSVKAGAFTIKKNDDNRIKVEVTMFKGREYLGIRWQFKNDEDEWCYTNKGISIPLANGVGEDFIKKFKEAF